MKNFIRITTIGTLLAGSAAMAQTVVGNTSNSVKGNVGTTIGNTVGSSVGGTVDSTVNAEIKAPPVSGAMKDGAPIKSGGASSTMMNWKSENEYWKGQYKSRPYYKSDSSYTIYEPAYHYGFDSYKRYGGKRYDDLDQTELKAEWERKYENSGLSWNQAQAAIRDSYDRSFEAHVDTSSSATVK